jgi:hypothetical protein
MVNFSRDGLNGFKVVSSVNNANLANQAGDYCYFQDISARKMDTGTYFASP